MGLSYPEAPIQQQTIIVMIHVQHMANMRIPISGSLVACDTSSRLGGAALSAHDSSEKQQVTCLERSVHEPAFRGSRLAELSLLG